MTEATQILEASKTRHAQKHAIYSSRSPGIPGRISPFKADQARDGVESSAWNFISLTDNDIRKNLDVGVEKLKEDKISVSSLMSSRSSPANAGSMIEEPHSSLYIQSPRRSGTRTSLSTRYTSSTLRTSRPRTPIAIGRGPSPDRTGKLIETKSEPKVQRESQASYPPVWRDSKNSHTYMPEKEGKQLGTPDRGRTSKVEYKSSDDKALSERPDISIAIKNSRRRRAERASQSTPFHDRYHHAERGKAWSSQKYPP